MEYKEGKLIIGDSTFIVGEAHGIEVKYDDESYFFINKKWGKLTVINIVGSKNKIEQDNEAFNSFAPHLKTSGVFKFPGLLIIIDVFSIDRDYYNQIKNREINIISIDLDEIFKSIDNNSKIISTGEEVNLHIKGMIQESTIYINNELHLEEESKIINSNITAKNIIRSSISNSTNLELNSLDGSKLEYVTGTITGNIDGSKIINSNITAKNIIRSSISNSTDLELNSLNDSELEDVTGTITGKIEESKIINSNITAENIIKSSISNSTDLELNSLNDSELEDVTGTITGKIERSNLSNINLKGDVNIYKTNLISFKERDIKLAYIENSSIHNLENNNLKTKISIKDSTMTETGSLNLETSEDFEVEKINITGAVSITNRAIVKNSKMELELSSVDITGDSIIDTEGGEIKNSKIGSKAILFGSPKIHGDKVIIRGSAKIFDNAELESIEDEINIRGNTNIYGNSKVEEGPRIYGRVNIFDEAVVSGKAVIADERIIKKREEVFE